MKHIPAVLLLICLSFVANAQQYKKEIKLVNDKSVVKFLNTVDSSFVKRANTFAMKFFVVSNGSGSAKRSGGHETNHSIVISVAEYDEYPVNKVYSIGAFYMPKFSEGRDDKGKYVISILHGGADDRKETRLIIDNHSITF